MRLLHALHNHVVSLLCLCVCVCVKVCVSLGIHLVDVTHSVLCPARCRGAAVQRQTPTQREGEPEHGAPQQRGSSTSLKHRWRLSEASGKNRASKTKTRFKLATVQGTFQLGGRGKSRFAVRRLKLLAVGKKKKKVELGVVWQLGRRHLLACLQDTGCQESPAFASADVWPHREAVKPPCKPGLPSVGAVIGPSGVGNEGGVTVVVM